MATSSDSPDREELFFLELNNSATTTIVLIPGLYSCHVEWDYVTPYLSNYHLLVIDSAGHSKSSHLLPATIPAASDRIAALIRNHAHGGRAHVVGMSMGGFLALNLAHRYPSLVLSAFASGSPPMEGAAKWIAMHPSIFWYLSLSMNVMPESVYWWSTAKQGLLPHKKLYDEVFKNKTWELTNEVLPSMAGMGWDDVNGIKEVRTIALAGAKKDPVDVVKKMGTVWKKKGLKMNKAVKIEEATHAWDMQLPELFARSIIAWVEQKPLPEELVEL